MRNSEAELNDFATRCFRDVADQDYIMARAAFRSTLYAQFLWLGLQAIEKYLKAILLYNRIPQPKGRHRLGHDLTRALELTNKLRFTLALSDSTRSIIKYLDTYGRFRYLESPYHVLGDELPRLDRAVWEIRNYCRVINFTATVRPGRIVDMLSINLKAIEGAIQDPSKKFAIPSGVLERILSSKNHPARSSLVWKNLYFNSHHRKRMKWIRRTYAVNPPLTLRPEILDEVTEYIWLPDVVVKAYREEANRRRSK